MSDRYGVEAWVGGVRYAVSGRAAGDRRHQRADHLDTLAGQLAALARSEFLAGGVHPTLVIVPPVVERAGEFEEGPGGRSPVGDPAATLADLIRMVGERFADPVEAAVARATRVSRETT